jgi:hypothetical protein
MSGADASSNTKADEFAVSLALLYASRDMGGVILVEDPDLASFFATPDSLGQAQMDVSFAEDNGVSTGFDGNVPFGFLSVVMQGNSGRFFYRFSVNGIAISMDGVAINYKDFNVSGAYRMLDRKIKLDAVLGVRYRVFDYNFDTQQTKSTTDIELSGPYVGLRGVF